MNDGNMIDMERQAWDQGGGTVGFVRRALNDARECGDVGRYWRWEDKIVLCLADGLGHGPKAEEAAEAAVACVGENLGQPLPAIFAHCDENIRSTRGAVMGIAVVDTGIGALTYAGVGNTRIVIGGAKKSSLFSTSGIVGGGYAPLYPETVRLVPGDVVAMYTDGFRAEIDLAAYTPSLRLDPQGLSEHILNDWSRGTDDAAVLVFRYEGQ